MTRNTVDRIELELARYLRPQVVRRASASAGIVVDGTSTGDAMSMLNNFYVSRVQYEEVRTLYIGLMSRSPANIGENNYTELVDFLIMGLAENPDEQDFPRLKRCFGWSSPPTEANSWYLRTRLAHVII